MISRVSTVHRSGDLKLALYAELVDRLFSNAVSIGAMGLLFTGFGMMVACRMGDAVLAGLVAAGGLASASHVTVVQLYRSGPRGRAPATLRDWEMRYAAAGFCSAAFVGCAAARTFLGGDLGSAMLMTGLIFGYASGTMARAATRPWITAPRLLVLVAAPVVVLVSRGDLLFGAQGLLLVLFLLAGLETMMSLYRHSVVEIETSLRRNETSRRDALTGLANRLWLSEILTERLARNAFSGQALAVHCLDLDGFKSVNDAHGHPIGDLLLQSVADRLTALVQADDVVARLGGDEFVVVQAHVPDLRHAERLAGRIVDALRVPHRFGHLDVTATASVGVALPSPGARNTETLLAVADAALYASKAAGRSRYTVRPAPSQQPFARPSFSKAS